LKRPVAAVICILVAASLSMSVLYLSSSAGRAVSDGEVIITRVAAGFFGIEPATCISYPHSAQVNSIFTIVFSIAGTVTRVYITTPVFTLAGWNQSGDTLSVEVHAPASSYTGLLAIHVVGSVPFSLIY